MNINPNINTIWSRVIKDSTVISNHIEIEKAKDLLSIFQVGDYYYYVFNIASLSFDFISVDVEKILGYKKEEMTVTFLLSKIHPEDQKWFLDIENKVVDFFSKLEFNQIPNYKVRYDYRIQTKNGYYKRVLQQVVTIEYTNDGGLVKTFGIHTDISHLKKEGNPVLSFIGLNGEPSYIDVGIEKIYTASTNKFTKREKEVLKLLIQGVDTKDIANKLCLTTESIYKFRKNLLRKSNCTNTVELVSRAIKEGWL